MPKKIWSQIIQNIDQRVQYYRRFGASNPSIDNTLEKLV